MIGGRLIRWNDETYAYGTAAPLPRFGSVDVLTPLTTLDVVASADRRG